MNTYGEALRIYSGPIDWRPDGSEVLVETTLESGTAYSRVNITNGVAAPVWNTTTLLPGSCSERSGISMGTRSSPAAREPS
jgi:hypothetical protein